MKNPILFTVILLGLGTFAQAADPTDAQWQKMFEVMYGLPKSPKDSQLERLKSLIDEGADVNAAIGFDRLLRVGETRADLRGTTWPLDVAIQQARVEMVKLLLAKGAKIDWSPSLIKTEGTPGRGGAGGRGGGTADYTPLMVAMKGGMGAPFAAGPGFSRLVAPPFREPGVRDPLEAVKVLLAAGADPNTKASDGSTPVHQAVQAQQVPMIRTLVAAGAKLDTANKDKLTPLGLAEKLKNTPVPPSTTNAEEEGYRPKKNTREEVVAALRELMQLGPNDPVPAPAPEPAATKPAPADKKVEPPKESPDEAQ